MGAGRCVDKLTCTTYPVSRLADTAFKNVSNTELTTDLFYVYRLSFVSKTGITGDTIEQPFYAGKCRNNILDNTVREVILFRIADMLSKGRTQGTVCQATPK